MTVSVRCRRELWQRSSASSCQPRWRARARPPPYSPAKASAWASNSWPCHNQGRTSNVEAAQPGGREYRAASAGDAPRMPLPRGSTELPARQPVGHTGWHRLSRSTRVARTLADRASRWTAIRKVNPARRSIVPFSGLLQRYPAHPLDATAWIGIRCLEPRCAGLPQEYPGYRHGALDRRIDTQATVPVVKAPFPGSEASCSDSERRTGRQAIVRVRRPGSGGGGPWYSRSGVIDRSPEPCRTFPGRRIEIQTGSWIRWPGPACDERPFPYPDRRKALQAGASTPQLAVSRLKASYRGSRRRLDTAGRFGRESGLFRRPSHPAPGLTKPEPPKSSPGDLQDRLK
jgi:hypothetical protein